MELYNFKARRASGEVVGGTINAENEAAVAAYIKNQGMYVTQIKKGNAESSILNASFFEKKVTLYDLATFCRQFATLVGAGVSLITALDILTNQTTNKKLKTVIQGVATEVHRGSSLSEAMMKYPLIFPDLLINMIQAGETGGILETVLYRLSDQYEKDYKLNAKLKSAMVYPAVVLGISAISVAIILTFVMPTFVTMFKSLNVELPWATKVVMALSDFLVHDWWMLVLCGIAVYLGYGQAMKKKKFRLWRDGVFLKFPVFGELYNKVIITRFASTFAGLSRSGVPILEALEIVSKSTGSLSAEEVLIAARANVQKGRGLADPMEHSKLFPPLVVNMVSIGEETGTLDHMLDKIAEFYNNEVDDMMNRLQSLLDPFLIVILGVVVGFIAVAMLLPMFDIVTKVGNV